MTMMFTAPVMGVSAQPLCLLFYSSHKNTSHGLYRGTHFTDQETEAQRADATQELAVSRGRAPGSDSGSGLEERGPRVKAAEVTVEVPRGTRGASKGCR